jgi:hypothetical protein
MCSPLRWRLNQPLLSQGEGNLPSPRAAGGGEGGAEFPGFLLAADAVRITLRSDSRDKVTWCADLLDGWTAGPTNHSGVRDELTITEQRPPYGLILLSMEGT